LSTSNLKPGMKGEFIDEEYEKSGIILSTSIFDVVDVHHLEIEIPVLNAKQLKFKAGKKYRVKFFDGASVLKTSFVPVKYLVSKDGKSLVVKLVSGVQKVQRREHFRIKYDIPFELTLIEKEINLLQFDSFERHSANIMDLSAGGIRFLSDLYIPENSKIGCRIPLDENVLFQVAFVLTSTKIENSIFAYSYRASFIGISSDEVDLIAKFIFNKERTNRNIT